MAKNRNRLKILKSFTILLLVNAIECQVEAQLKELQSVGCDKIYQEQISSIAERSQLKAAMDFVREG